MKKVLTDYGISQDTMVVYCDNSSAIDISKNTVQHSKTKHIEIRYHFIRDLVERKIVCLEYIPTKRQNADIFTKPLNRSKFETLRQVIGVILCPWSVLAFHGPCASLLFLCDHCSLFFGFCVSFLLSLGVALHYIHAFHSRCFFYSMKKNMYLGSKDFGFYVFRNLNCIVGKPWSKQCIYVVLDLLKVGSLL